jgi:hypothetical protein
MKWLVNIHTPAVKRLNGPCPLMAVMIVVVMWFSMLKPAEAQFAEVEILGIKKYPFTLVVDQLEYPVPRTGRVVASRLPPGNTAITILFSDSLMIPLHDTVTLAPGMRYVYRLLRATPYESWLSGITGRNQRSRIETQEEAAAILKMHPFRIRLLEVIPAKEDFTTPVSADQDSAGIRWVHRSEFQFSRQDPVPSTVPQTTPTQEEANGTPPAIAPSGSVAATESAHKVLTGDQLNTLRRRITDQPFEEDKMKLLDAGLKEHHLTAAQLNQLLVCFDFERSKKRVFQTYFPQLTDKENHPLLYRAFDFSSTVEELKQWVNEQ